MPEPLDERRLGELLLISGKLSQEALLACMQTQQQLGGPKRKQLSEILVERGLVSPNELAALTGDQGSLALWCPSCAVTMSAPGAAPGTRFACQQCGSELQPAAGAANPTVMESSAATPPPDANPHDVDDDVRRAMADPRQRIGRYVKLEELGRGGMGVVYRCYDPQLRREVAIKEISTQSTAGSQALARFKREAQACAKLRHPGIVAVYEAGEHGGNHYLVMDLVKGRLLQDEIGTSSLSPRDLARVMRDLALALDHAHSAGIIHRDVKPENIIIDEKNQPLLMDFGLAKDLTAAKHLTQAGHVMGTPLYMAPEQVSEGELGPWTDIHALGAVLYHMLVGRSPYDGSDTPSVFRSILLEEPKPPRQLDPTINADLETITLKCLEKQPDCRYPSGAAVAAELQHFLDGQAILARPIGRRESAMRWARRNRTLTAALASAVAAVVLVVIGAAIILMRQAESARQEQRQQQRESDRKAARSEERATLVAKYTAIDKERERAREEALAQLRIEVEAVLDRVRSGEALEDPNVRRIERAKLLGHRDPAAVALLSHELDQLSEHLGDTQSLDHGQELYLHLLCDTLADLGVREAAVESIGRYLSTERALPDEHRNQLRAVAAGKALCLLGGEEAERFLLEAREGLGINGPFWTQVKPLYSYTGVVPDLEAQTTAAYMKRGMLRKEKGDLNGAIADYTRAIEADPNYSGALINRGIALKDLGDLEGAIRDYSRAIEIDPDNGMAWNNRGVARLNGGDVAGAISDYTQAIEAAPDYAPAWYHRGNARMLQGDLQRAIDDTTRAVEIDPSNAACWFNRGVALSSNGDIDAAIDDYASAIERDPGLIAAWINRSNLRFTKRDFDGAITDASRAIELDPKHAVGWGNRGNARQGKGDLEGAVADYTRAIEINPNFAMALSNRGSIRSDRGDLDDAIADTSRAIQSNPNYANAWGVRGNARYGKGDIDGAIADATRAIDLNANLVEAWGVRGLARRARGDLDGAIADWEQFLRLAPRNPKAPVVRREVKKLRQQRAKASAGGGQ